MIDWQVCVVSVCRIWTSHQTLLLVQLWAVRQANWTFHLMMLVSNMPLINFLSTDRRDSCFQCFYTVGWASERASGCKDWVMRCCSAPLKLRPYGAIQICLLLLLLLLLWLSIWSEVQIVWIWSSWCQCIPKPPSSLASFKSRLFVTFLVLANPGCHGKDAVRQV